jgi:ABC-type Fe3+-siderophore transport system permease subunit
MTKYEERNMENLTAFEKRDLQDFVNSIKKPLVNPFIISSIVSIAGLVMIAVAVLITLNNFVDRIVYLVFIPGMLSGIIIVLLGSYIFNYSRKYERARRVAEIIKKLTGTT